MGIEGARRRPREQARRNCNSGIRATGRNVDLDHRAAPILQRGKFSFEQPSLASRLSFSLSKHDAH
jgi:hypothetical protein